MSTETVEQTVLTPTRRLKDTRTGLAIDLGTTSVTLSLVDLGSEQELACIVCPNPQSAFGPDIMSRLSFALMKPGNGVILRQLVLDSITGAFSHLMKMTGLEPEQATKAVLVGNTAMHHLALGLPVESLSTHPFKAFTLDPLEVSMAGLPPLYAPPPVGSFVGSDLVSAAIATGIASQNHTSLLVDVGTNSEVLLNRRGRLYACSAPAGPALEGAEISQGMLALPGAIHQVSSRFDIQVIGGGNPKGMCGSGILDAVVALLGSGVLNSSGLMRVRDDFPGRISREADGSLKFRLAPGVFLTQKDVRAVQLGKGAVRTAIDCLLAETGITPGELDILYLAGSFGSSLKVESALAVGLIPWVEPQRVSQVGNAAIVGAKAMLLSKSSKVQAENLAGATQHIDLACLPGFSKQFLSSLSLGC